MTQDEIEKSQALSDWYKKLTENKNGWNVLDHNRIEFAGSTGPNMISYLSNYIVNEPKPENKIIDMSICIYSNIDVEFYSSLARYWYVVKLTGASERGYLSSNNSSRECRLRENHWYSHDKCKKCPIPVGFKIEVGWLNGVDTDLCYETYDDYSNKSFDWENVIKYRIIDKLPNYKYDWE